MGNPFFLLLFRVGFYQNKEFGNKYKTKMGANFPSRLDTALEVQVDADAQKLKIIKNSGRHVLYVKITQNAKTTYLQDF